MHLHSYSTVPFSDNDFPWEWAPDSWTMHKNVWMHANVQIHARLITDLITHSSTSTWQKMTMWSIRYFLFLLFSPSRLTLRVAKGQLRLKRVFLALHNHCMQNIAAKDDNRGRESETESNEEIVSFPTRSLSPCSGTGKRNGDHNFQKSKKMY